MARNAKTLLLGVTILLLAACGRKSAPTQSVYATAYALVTQTAIAQAKLPTNTITNTLPATVKPSDTATPSASNEILVTSDVVAPSPTSAPQAPLVNNPTSIPTAQRINPTTFSTQSPSGELSNNLFSSTNTPTPTRIPTVSNRTPTIPPPDQGLIGLWQQYPTGQTFRFNPDGTYLLGDSFQNLASQPLEEGQFVIQNEQITLTGSSSSDSCKGMSGSYQIQTPSSGQRLFILVQDLCFDRLKLMPGKPWYWLPLQPDATPVATSAAERPVVVLPLTGPLADLDAKITGLTWYNDYLIFLPQNPNFVGDNKSDLFAVQRSDIIAFINGVTSALPPPLPVPFNDTGLPNLLPGFQGYQAIAIAGERVYLIALADPGSGPRSYLVAGNIATELSAINLDVSKIVEIPVPASALNRIYRALFITNDNILALSEFNGAVNPSPASQRFDTSLNKLESVSLSGSEYRLTDATAPDANGRIWVLNIFVPGDPGATTGVEPLAQLYGKGVTHQVFDYVERLIQYQFSSTGITLTASPPVQLELSAHGPRNWQGVARLGDQGFLVVTDQQTGTIFGYINNP